MIDLSSVSSAFHAQLRKCQPRPQPDPSVFWISPGATTQDRMEYQEDDHTCFSGLAPVWSHTPRLT